MRLVPIAFALLIPTAPAFAAEHHVGRPTSAEAVQALGNPVVQDLAARELTELAGIVLDTRVGPLGALAGPEANIRPSDTLRDLNRRDDPQFEEHLYRDTRRAIGTAAMGAGAAEAQVDELRRTAARLHDALAPLLGTMAHDDSAPRADR